jgi:uncharacterized protein YgbK (DUF1537 family)
LLGCIATGLQTAVGAATIFTAQGARASVSSVPIAPAEDAQVLVVAIGPAQDSLTALALLQAAGCQQVFFMYGAGFDDTIGPVTEALLDALAGGFALTCPASPAQGCTVYQGHMFIGARQAEQGNLVHALSRQTDGTVGLIGYATVAQGPGAVRDAISRLREQGRRHAIADALDDAHLLSLAEAAAAHPLLTGAAGLAGGIAAHWRRSGRVAGLPREAPDPPPAGRGVVLVAGATRTTLYQIGAARAHLPLLELAAGGGADMPAPAPAEALAWVESQWAGSPEGPALMIAVPPAAAEWLGDVAAALVARGVGRLLVAGEAAVAPVAAALGVRRLRVGPWFDEGLAWMVAECDAAPAGLWLAIKPGDGGSRYVFVKAFEGTVPSAPPDQD